MDDPSPKLSVVVPCYNEQAVLPTLYERVRAVCDRFGAPSEIVLINDGSTDATWPMISDLVQRDPRVVGVNLSRNHGHQLALTAGLSVCQGERILIIDADLQDPPEALSDMWSVIDQGADVVYGQRAVRHGESRLKRWTAAIFYRLLERLTECKIPRDAGDFRLITRRVLDSFLAMPERHRFVRGMVSWLGFKQVPYIYDRHARVAGESHYPFGKMFRLAWDAVVGFSVKPLSMPLWLGVASSISGVLLAITALLTFSQGFALAALICVLFGVQLLALGVQGQYLGRMYAQVQGRPLYVIEQVLRHAEAVSKPIDDTVGLRRSA